MESVEGENTEIIEQSDFFQKVVDMGIELKHQERAAMMSVLTKQHPEGKIYVKDLTTILETFGVPERLEEGSKRDSVNKKKPRKPLNYQDLSPEALRVMGLFTDYLLDSDTSVYEFFDG